MHLTRPKSSKGRSRAAVNTSLHTGGGDTDSSQRTPVSPVDSRPDRSLRSQSQPIMWQAGQLSQDEVLQMLHHTPAAPPPSLNKYKVLPSIERRQRSLDTHMSTLSLSDDAVAHTCSPEVDRRADGPPDPGPNVPGEAGPSGSLLLAIRAPCGRRFQQHFEPTDTLLMVRSSAEDRYGATYGDTASIETMDVPRRTFTDMDMTLSQCGIINRSVLCISQRDREVEHQ
ncbi:UBX domain-containing protein 10 [Symphorus nematophorus]